MIPRIQGVDNAHQPLEGEPMTDTTKRLITIVLDRSGSMATVKHDTEGGLRSFLNEQKNAAGDTRVTLRQFDTRHDTVFENIPLADVPPFELRPRGGTALLDAIGSTITTVAEHIGTLDEADRPGEVVIVILTDGFENSSKEWTLPAVKDAITTRQNTDGWTFVFLGADQDAISAGASMGIRAETSMAYASAHTSDAMTSAGRAVARGSRSGDYRFTDEERTRSGLGDTKGTGR